LKLKQEAPKLQLRGSSKRHVTYYRPMTDIYERELKGILGGEDKFVERAGTWDAAYTSLLKHPFLVVKAGGSLGIDLLAARGYTVLPIEVKASASRVFRFSRSKRILIQAEAMDDVCRKAGLVPLYAYRIKRAVHDPWRIFVLGDVGNQYTRMLPRMELTKGSNMIMRWEKGMPLGRFIATL
jgi:Holliday junction resolvase